MPIPVSLREVGQELQIVSDEIFAFINRKSGELVSMSEEYLTRAEDGYDPEEVIDWEVDILEIAANINESEDFLALPTKFEIHEYSIMEDFCNSLEDDDVASDLARAMRGSGAFGRFRYFCEQNDLIDSWYKYKNTAYEVIAAKWLDENQIPYVRS